MPRQVVGWRVAAAWLVLSGSLVAGAEVPLEADPRVVTSLDGSWAFHLGDHPAGADPSADASAWASRHLLDGVPETEVPEGWFWYRRVVDISPDGRRLSEIDRASLHLGISLGKIDSAYELFAGGERLGGAGVLPPTPRIDYDRHRVFEVPPSAIDAEGRIVLALRVWASPETLPMTSGPREGPFFIGPATELVRRDLVAELPFLFLGGWFLLLGVAHLELYRRRRQLRSYLWFALLAIGFGVYSLLRTQWKYGLGVDFVWLKEVEHLACYLNTALFIQLYWPLLGRRIGPILRGIQALCLVAGSIGALPGLYLNLLLLPGWQILVLCVLVAAIARTVQSIWHGQPGARTLAVGGSIAVALLAHDVLVDRGFYVAPRLAAIGFGVFVTTLAITLAQRFVRLHREVEDLRRSEEANRLKSDFLANMSHELRTPITGILGTADLLGRLELPDRGREYADIIRSSAQSLIAIVDDVLDFSKVEAGHLALETVVFPLPETVRGVIDLLAPRARSKGLDLVLDLDPTTPPQVEGDPLRLRQVLLNLLGNGLKFTSTGEVRVRVERLTSTGDHVRMRFSVRDTGIGIEPSDLDRLFLPFTQADSSTTRRYGGTGLGLAISRRIVEAMGGRLSVRSRRNVGSTFAFELNLALPTTEISVTPSASAQAADSPATATAAAAERTSTGSILLVEDNPINHLVVEEQLIGLGHRVRSAYNGREALDLLDRETFDLVLMDCQMPEIDGYEATRRIRQAEVGDRHVPIIALTAHALEGDREKCLAAGMDDYLAKPFTTEELAALLGPWLGTAG